MIRAVAERGEGSRVGETAARRNRRIRADFDGANYEALARRHALSVEWVRYIVDGPRPRLKASDLVSGSERRDGESREDRNRRIRARFNGDNLNVLALQFGLSPGQVYRVLRRGDDSRPRGGF
ncbi:MAG: hypothetical protein OXC69_10205 [Candidatus Tectomicrobia bacterium]|nr:hypothetical protein [Candidatus Tectomicrobia bacterium]